MKCYTKTISNLRDLYKYKQLELNPPYQRRPVWKTKQRTLLISSIFNGIPIPAIILHKHFDKRKNKDIYDVLDGKQRVETILHFIQMLEIENEDEWTIKIKKNSEELLPIKFADLKSKVFNKEHNQIAERFWKYDLPIVEYEEEIIDFFENPVPTMDVFVRINSTGSILKRNEIRHANSSAPFFKLGEELEKKYQHRFVNIWKIFTENDVHRYSFHEFIMELCTIIYFKNFTDRRKKLEELLYNHTWTTRDINDIRLRYNKIIIWLKSIMSDSIFSNTRFRNKSDFYSLFVVLNSLIEQKYVTTNINDNKILGNTLLEFSKTAQLAGSDLKKFNISSNLKNRYEVELLNYIIATKQSTDSQTNRSIRNEYLKRLLKGFFLKKKDDKRIFDENIKGVLWTRLLQRTSNPRCPNPNNNPKCTKTLTFENTQVDHVHPWSKGGKSDLKNAQLICSSCNRSKGAR